MKRFVLIDQSITGEGGHYLSYARAVLDAAAEEGLVPVLCVNRRFQAAGGLPYRVYPSFSYTSLESKSSFRLQGSAAGGKGYLWGGVVKPAVQRAARLVFGARYREVRARFFPQKAPQSGETAEQVYKAACFSQDLLSLLSVLDLNVEDIVFFPTISIVELHGLEQALRGLDRSKLPSVHLLFRWNPFQGRRKDYSREMEQMEYERDCFRSCEDISILHFYTDSERLAEQYNYFSQCRFSVLPIPHTGYPARGGCRENGTPVISYLGDARPEKGFLHLPKIIKALSGEKVQFQVQANFNIPGGEGGVAACRRKLRHKTNVTLYETALDAEQYAAALVRTDIMLILYDPEQYYARSSGIFAEAMALGIPALVPADTWMSAQVCKGRYVQLRKLAEEFGVRQINMEVTGEEFFWKRKKDFATQIILRFTIDWECGGDSVRIEAAMESDSGVEIGRTVDFVERDGNNSCFLLVEVPQESSDVTFRLSGTYGQPIPKICALKVIEMLDNAPEFMGICKIFDDFDQCGAILKSMIEHCAEIQKSTDLYSKTWSAYHNAKYLVNHLL